MTTIPSITAYSGTIPDKDTQTKEDFANNVYPYLNYIDKTFVPSFEAAKTAMNAWDTDLAEETDNIEAKVTEASNYANDSASHAAESASHAVDSANSAIQSAQYRDESNAISFSAVNSKGEWSNLTGALNIPASVSHNDNLWILANDLADVTASEPSDTNPDWQIVKIIPNTTKAVVSRAFSVNEEYVIDLDGNATTPNVSVTKEAPQVGITNNDLQIDTNGADYTIPDEFEVVDGVLGFKKDVHYSIGAMVYDNKYAQPYHEVSNMAEMQLSNDDSKMYILDNHDDTVYQYTIYTVNDISTLVYDSVSFSVTNEENNPWGLLITNNGTKMYIAGDTKAVYQYSLSTAYDLSTASYDSKSFDASAKMTSSIVDVIMNDDGTKMFLLGYDGDTSKNEVLQYTLSTAYDVSTASYDSVHFNVSAQDAYPSCIQFNNDGTKFFMSGSQGTFIHSYSLSTAYDLSTMSYDNIKFDYSPQDANYKYHFVFNNDGSKLFAGNYQYRIAQYSSLGVIPAYSDRFIPAITNAVGQINSGYWIQINSATAISDNINGGEISYAFSTDNKTTFKVSTHSGVRNIVRDNSGTWEYNSDTTFASETWTAASVNNIETVFDEALSNASGKGFTISKAEELSENYTYSNEDNSMMSCMFNNDGTKLFTMGGQNNKVYEYDLSTPYSLSGISYSSSFDISAQTTSTPSLAFSKDGTRMFTTDYSNKIVYSYTLSTPFDITTASYDSISLDVSSHVSALYGLDFSQDGTKMFINDMNNKRVWIYILSTAFDISTASYDTYFNHVIIGAYNIIFAGDGFYLFVLTGEFIYMYPLSTAYDLSTASTSIKSPSFGRTEMQGIAVSADGTKYIVTNNNDDTFRAYNMIGSQNSIVAPEVQQFDSGDTLDLAILMKVPSDSASPSSEGINISYDAMTHDQAATIGTDYEWYKYNNEDTKLTFKSLIDNNFKIRVV